MKRISNNGFRFMHRRYLLIPLIAAAVIALFGYGFMQLWNSLVPQLFHLSAITFWQAVGLLLLSKLLFGFGPGGRGRWRRSSFDGWQHLTAEERERFREKMRSRCRSWWPPEEAGGDPGAPAAGL